jgi:chromosome segregation ATPase
MHLYKRRINDVTKIQDYILCIHCFLCSIYDATCQYERTEDNNVHARVVDLGGAVPDLKSLIEEMSDTIEKMSDAITELESKLAVIEYDLELATGKVEQTEEDLSTLVKWTGTGFMDGGSIQKNYMTLFQNAKEERQSVRLPSSGHMFMT